MLGTFPLFDGTLELQVVAPSCVVRFALTRSWASGGMLDFQTSLAQLFHCLTDGAYVLTVRVLAGDGSVLTLGCHLVHAPLQRGSVLDAHYGNLMGAHHGVHHGTHHGTHHGHGAPHGDLMGALARACVHAPARI